MKKLSPAFFLFAGVLFICLYFRSFGINFPQLDDQAEGSKEKYQDKNNQTFLSELDCWHWARYTENSLKYGHPWDKVEGNKKIDSLMLSPFGAEIIWPQFLFYFSAFLYRIFSLVWPIPLFTFLFYLPLFFTSGLLLVLFIFCRRYWGQSTALIACLAVGLSAIFINRSSAGWFDTDILNLIFPLLIIWGYLAAQNAQNTKAKVFWFALSSFWLGLFCSTWLFWWFIYFIIIFYECVSCFLIPDEKFSRRILRVSLFSLASGIWIFVFCRGEPFSALPRQFFSSLFLNDTGAGSVWPNTFSTVAELRKIGFLQIGSLIGSAPLFFFGIASIALLLIRIKRYEGFKQRAITLLASWFLLMLFACTKGSRFVMFLLIPLGISFGWIMEELVSGQRKMKGLFSNLLIAGVLLLALVPLVKSAAKEARENFPLMNRKWYSVLEHLKLNTPEGSVINSWWDYGDWFTSVSQRPVIFDGHTQEYPQAYWMGRVLLADNEEEAMAILRMLNNSANRPFDIINQHLRNPYKSLFILKKALASPRDSGRILSAYLPPDTAEEIGKMLLAKPKHKAYFVVDYSMPSKMEAISYLGNWDAAKVYQRKDLKQRKTRVLKFYSGKLKGEKFGNTIIFKDVLAYLPEAKQAKFLTHPNRERNNLSGFSIFENNQVISKSGAKTEGNDEEALIFEDGDGYSTVLLSQALARSLFVRLYYLDGKGLKHFTLFWQEKDGDKSIKVFEILWE